MKSVCEALGFVLGGVEFARWKYDFKMIPDRDALGMANESFRELGKRLVELDV